MSLNYNKGRFLCRIDGDPKNKKIIRVDENEYDNIVDTIKINKGKLQQIPNIDKERDILYITGPSGSGKSTYARNYLQIYKKIYPENPIYLFSELLEDESIDDLLPKRVKLTEDGLIPVTQDDLKNSICIFDDIDNITNKNLRLVVYNLLNKILENGRHSKTSCIVTQHLPSNGIYTRKILNECSTITYFPNSGSAGKIFNFLQNYIGLTKKDFLYNKKIKSRWITIFKNYPLICMSEKEIRILDE
jgi:energy-coupling factor transporter ATP-binding protein EcfA2